MKIKYKWYESWWFILVMFLLWPLVVPFFVGCAMLHLRHQKQAEWNKKILEERFKAYINSIPSHDPVVNPDKIIKRQKLRDMPEIKIKNITKRTNLSLLPAFAVIDTETTGLNASSDRIIELSAVIYESFTPTETYTTLINPGCHIPENASQINSIYDADVQGAPTIGNIADDFLNFIDNLPVVGYNIPFDLQFLYCSGIDIISNRKIYDAYKLARKAFPGLDSYSLVNVSASLGISYPAHRSLADCIVTGAVFNAEAKEIAE